jgi:predicted ABC-type transport system involved in lysophospholipase L1 biosynthesis ATPase subunit
VVLQSQAIRKDFKMGSRSVAVLKDIALTVRQGETVSIMGASGAGKTTMLHVLGGLDAPTGGSVTLLGQDLYRMSRRRRAAMRARAVGFVFQAYYLLPELDVLDNVLLPLRARGIIPGGRHRERAMTFLERVGLSDRADHRPAELSGGEQQRAALVRALMNEPQLVLCDEPTGNLDSATGAQVLQCLFDLVQEAGHTLIMVSHNREVAARCQRMLQLRDGVLEESGDVNSE